jgi:ribosomal protein S18 acetylase RimI-like enzyme
MDPRTGPPGSAADSARAGDLPHPYAVRPATPADQGALEEVRRRAWHAAYDALWGHELIEQYFAGRIELRGSPRPEGWVKRPWTLVAHLDGEITGLASAGVLTGKLDKLGELGKLYVAPEHQGKGVGVRLWDEVVRRLRAAGCRHLQLWVLSRNTRARRFYERRGCHPFVESTVYLGARAEPEIGYRLPL